MILTPRDIKRAKVFLFSILITILLFSFVSAVSMPYAQWHLNGTSGINVMDSSNNSLNGTIINNASFVAGKLGNALNFNGVNQSVNFTKIAQFERNQSFSFVYWFNTSSSGSSMAFMGNLNTSNSKGIWIHSASRKINFNFQSSGANLITVTQANQYSLNAHHFVVITYDGSGNASNVKIYMDNSLQAVNITADSLTTGSAISNANFLFGARSDGYPWNGMLDEVSIYNAVLNTSDIDYLYNSGSGTEGVPIFINSTFNYQIPSDLNTTMTSTNISYNISRTNNLSNVFLYYKVNSTLHDNCWVFVNGSNYKCGLTQKLVSTNTTNTFNWNFDDSDIFPSTHNIIDTTINNLVHTDNVFANVNSYVKVQFLNVSNTESNNVFMIMANTSGASPLNVYYCNSTYSTGDPSINVSCNNFYNLGATGSYSDQENASKYNLLPMTINVTSGMVGTVKVTPISYLIIKSSAVFWHYGTVAEIARTGATQTTVTNGNSWSNFAGTLDAHLHQFDGNDTLNYFAEACDITSFCINSTFRADRLEVGNQVPTTPVFIKPIQYFYNNNLTINYTASFSPNGYQIMKYNLTLLNPDFSFNQTITANNSQNLTFVYDTNLSRDAYYTLMVTVCDINNLCSNGFSFPFLIDNTPPYGDVLSPSGILNSRDTNFTINITDNQNVSNFTLYIMNGSNFTINETFMSVNNQSGIFNIFYHFIADGFYSFFVTIFDYASNSFTSIIKFVNIVSLPPIMNITYPLNNSNYTYTIQNIFYSINGEADNCWYSLNNGLTNISTICNGVVNGLSSIEGINSWTIYGNNSLGENFSQVIFNATCSNPNVHVSLTSYPYADINQSYHISLTPFVLGNSVIKLDVQNSAENSTYNFTYINATQSYDINLTFINETDYRLIVSGDGICPTIESNLIFNVLVRSPYYITVRLFNQNDFSAIDTDFSYITAEYTSVTNPTAEAFLFPLISNQIPAFNSPYINGEAVLKLYEPSKYKFRYYSGDIDFNGQYVVPNITKEYRTPVFLGTQNLNGSNELIQFVLGTKDLHPYFWLFNWIMIILIGLSIICGITIFFKLPQYPLLGLVLGIGFPIMIVALRIIVWFFVGS